MVEKGKCSPYSSGFFSSTWLINIKFVGEKKQMQLWNLHRHKDSEDNEANGGVSPKLRNAALKREEETKSRCSVIRCLLCSIVYSCRKVISGNNRNSG